jgi:hypothetical protein
MSESKSVDRRLFVKSSVAAAVSLAAAGTVQACPLFYDVDGKLADWWCIYHYDIIDSQTWVYYWKNCTNGATAASIGGPGAPIGNCSNAPSNPSCALSKVIFDWEAVTIDGEVYRIPPDVDSETRARAVRLISARTAKRNL